MSLGRLFRKTASLPPLSFVSMLVAEAVSSLSDEYISISGL